MSYQEYFEHYIQFPYFPIFTLIARLLLLIIYALVFCFAWKTQKGSKPLGNRRTFQSILGQLQGLSSAAFHGSIYFI